MKVHLTFDVEIWCGGWTELDRSFPHHFERCVAGHSQAGDFALPKTLEILRRHGLTAVFFVEVMFSARFGAEYLERIVSMIRADGHETQLHIHTEWVDELSSPPVRVAGGKRQYIAYFDLEDQVALIAHGKKLLEAAGGAPVTAFRAGGFAANRDTFKALDRNGIRIDSSLNACYAISGADVRDTVSLHRPSRLEGVTSLPITVFRDGLGRPRPAQVGSCSFQEMRDALEQASRAGRSNFVVLSHNTELLRPGSSRPDWTVVRRFERLCAYLERHRDRLPVTGYGEIAEEAAPVIGAAMPRAGAVSTMRRHVEQFRRRLG